MRTARWAYDHQLRKVENKRDCQVVKMENLEHGYVNDPATQAEVRKLSRLRPTYFTLNLLGNWLVIVACIALWMSTSNLWLWPVLAFLISTRQQALGLLVHDVAHYRYMRRTRVADAICNLMMAFPLLYNVQEYRRHHLNHHRYLNSELDPDWMQKVNREEYATPMTRWRMFRRMLWAAGGGGLYEMLRYLLFFYKKDFKKTATAVLEKPEVKKSKGLSPGQMMALYYIVILGVLIWTGCWKVYLVMWLLPMLTVLMGLLELRSLTEHIGFVDDGTHYTKSRSVRSSWLEGFLLNPHNAHYHLEHHMFPSVPFYNLPSLHAHLMTTGEFSRSAQVASNYFGSRPDSVVAQLRTKQKIVPGV